MSFQDAPYGRPHIDEDRVAVYHGDSLEVLRGLPDASVDAVVTDPPYELGFMGKGWDASGIAYRVDLWAEALRVLKPGGHMLAFGGTRTWHRLACAIEDAGFEVRDSIAWLYGSGFPKSLNVAIAIDKAAGAMQHRGVRSSFAGNRNAGGEDIPNAKNVGAHDPVTDAAREWQGWGTALKPAHEPIVVARKPLVGTVAANVLEHGTGALNIDGCRIPSDDGFEKAWDKPVSTSSACVVLGGLVGEGRKLVNLSANKPNGGRWPANVVLDEDQAAELDRQAAASRFFYVAKAPAKERPKVDGIAHPTVKPLTLMRWLCRLVTPPNGLILEPFAGSGTTVEAALLEGFRVIAIEREADYLPLIQARLDRVEEGDDGQLSFDTPA